MFIVSTGNESFAFDLFTSAVSCACNLFYHENTMFSFGYRDSLGAVHELYNNFLF